VREAALAPLFKCHEYKGGVGDAAFGNARGLLQLARVIDSPVEDDKITKMVRYWLAPEM
jgi:hypothetical protein